MRKLKRSYWAGLGFGATSGIITPLGLIIGLYSSTRSSVVIMGGILIIAIADAFSDALGVHVSKEADREYSVREIWEATLTTFFSKFFFALAFVIPFLLFSLTTAVLVSVFGGVLVLAGFSYVIAKHREGNTWLAVAEHLSIAFIVIAITYYLPVLIEGFLGQTI